METQTLKRIDPEAVPGLFARLGLYPAQDLFCEPSESECCVDVALAADKIGVSAAFSFANKMTEWGNITLLAQLAGLDADYAIGLAKGWDDVGTEGPEGSPEVLGYADGKAAWEACQRARD